MSDLQTSSIALAKIKVRWQEPYVSEAVNRQLSAIARGILRGGLILANSTPDQGFKIAIDDGSGLFEDTCFIYADKTNGFSLMVRDGSDVAIDMSAEFSGGGATIPSDVTWYVWADVDYSTSVPTVGTYHVSDSVPPDDAVVFGKIEMLMGDTTIVTARISHTPRTIPVPTKRESGVYSPGDEFYGLLSGEESWKIPSYDEKKAMDAATTPTVSNPFVTKADTLDKYFGEPILVDVAGLVATNRFQLSGWYYVGKTSQSDAVGNFSLRDYFNKRYPLMDIGGDSKQIVVYQVRKNDDSANLDPATDPGVDAYGFYQNPWITMETIAGPFSYTGNLKVLTCRKKQFSSLDQNPADTLPNATYVNYLHAFEVFMNAVSGNPNSVGFGFLSQVIEQLLVWLNHKTIDTNVGTGWKLLWRSHSKTSDGAVDKRTISLYVGRESTGLLRTFYAFCVGGYLSTADFTKFVVGVQPTTPTIAVNCDVMMVYVETGSEGALHFKTRICEGAEIPAGSTWDWETGIEKDNSSSDGDCLADARHVSSASMTPVFSGDDLGKKIKIGTDYHLIKVVDSGTKIEYYGPDKTGTGYDVKVYGWTLENKMTFGDMSLDGTRVDLFRGSYFQGEEAKENGMPTWLRFFVGNSTSYVNGVYGGIWYNHLGSIAITRNAVWDSNTEKWMPKDDTANAQALVVSASGTVVYYKSLDDSIASGWIDGVGSGKWTSAFAFGISTSAESSDSKDCFACAEVFGELYEKIVYKLYANNPTDTNDDYLRGVSQSIQFRNRWNSSPSSAVVDEDFSANWATTTIVLLGYHSSDNWGFVLDGTTDVLDSGQFAYAYGVIHLYD